jgi:hypothetical protein
MEKGPQILSLSSYSYWFTEGHAPALLPLTEVPLFPSSTYSPILKMQAIHSFKALTNF